MLQPIFTLSESFSLLPNQVLNCLVNSSSNTLHSDFTKNKQNSLKTVLFCLSTITSALVEKQSSLHVVRYENVPALRTIFVTDACLYLTFSHR